MLLALKHIFFYFYFFIFFYLFFFFFNISAEHPLAVPPLLHAARAGVGRAGVQVAWRAAGAVGRAHVLQHAVGNRHQTARNSARGADTGENCFSYKLLTQYDEMTQ